MASEFSVKGDALPERARFRAAVEERYAERGGWKSSAGIPAGDAGYFEFVGHMVALEWAVELATSQADFDAVIERLESYL